MRRQGFQKCLLMFWSFWGLILLIEPSLDTAAESRLPLHRVCRDGTEMILIPKGLFPLSRDERGGSKPSSFYSPELAYRIVWGQGFIEIALFIPDFYIDRTEVTNLRYRRFARATGHPLPRWIHDSRFNGALQPVVGVSWEEAAAYCRWAGKRLPKELEWEKAARGKTWRFTPWGKRGESEALSKTNPVNRANFNVLRPVLNDFLETRYDADGYHYTAPVGSFPAGASPYGVHDLLGNVWEWVNDYYDLKKFGYLWDKRPSPKNPGDLRVLKGGSWINFWTRLSISLRRWDPADFKGDYTVGFRCAASAPAENR